MICSTNHTGYLDRSRFLEMARTDEEESNVIRGVYDYSSFLITCNPDYSFCMSLSLNFGVGISEMVGGSVYRCI